MLSPALVVKTMSAMAVPPVWRAVGHLSNMGPSGEAAACRGDPRARPGGQGRARPLRSQAVDDDVLLSEDPEDLRVVDEVALVLDGGPDLRRAHGLLEGLQAIEPQLRRPIVGGRRVGLVG